MEDIKEKIKNKGYRNWVKCTLGLEQTKKGVHNYVLEKFKSYTERRSKMHPNDMLSESEVDHMNGTEYIRHSLRQSLQYTGKKWRWRIETYPCHDCESAFGKILSLHTKGIGFKDIWWENSDNTTKISLEWAIAKMFMPQGNENNTCPEDTDPAALFYLMLMCKLFNNCPHPTKVNKLKEIRNTLFHSSTNTVSDDDAHEYFEVMVTFLQEASYDQDMVAGVKNEIDESSKKIDTLKTSDITMTLIQDAENALQIKRKALYYDFDEQLCKNDPEKLREILKLAEQLGGDIELLKKHIQDMKGAEKYEAENEQLRKERDKLCDGIKVTSVNMQTVKRMCEELCCDARGRTDEISKSLVQVKEEIEKRIHISSQNHQKDQKTIEKQRVEIQNLSKRNEDPQVGVRNVSRLTQTLKYELGRTNVEIHNELCETNMTIIQNREKIFTRHLEDTKRIENYKISNQAMCKEREQLRRGIRKVSVELTEIRESCQQIVIDIRQDLTRTNQEINENIQTILQRHTEDTVTIESQKLKIAELEGNISDMREGIFTILENVNRLRKSHAEMKVAFQTTSAQYTEWLKEANIAIMEECRRMCRQADRVRDVANDVSLRTNELRQLLEEFPFVRNEAHGTYDNTVELRNAVHLRIPQNIGDRMMVWVPIAAIVVAVILKIWELLR